MSHRRPRAKQRPHPRRAQRDIGPPRMGVRAVSGSGAFARERLARAAAQGIEGPTCLEAFGRRRDAEPADRVGRPLGGPPGLPGPPAASRASRKGRRVHD